MTTYKRKTRVRPSLLITNKDGYNVVRSVIHEGTKYEHDSLPLKIDQRRTTNYCAKCNGWFRRSA